MLTSVIAKVRQPVVGLLRRVENAFVSEAALHRHHCRFSRVSCLERFQISDQIVQFRFRQTLTEVGRHDRLLSVLDLGNVFLSEQGETLRRSPNNWIE